MTYRQLFLKATKDLDITENAEFEVLCMLEDLIDVRKERVFIDETEISESDISVIESAVKSRKSGMPLQYILGNWDFYDLTFKVGKGVLIPRPETELLVDFAIGKLWGTDNPVVYDLCAGSGCVGLTIAKHRPDATVYLLEKESAAFEYLKTNKEYHRLDNAVIIKGDLFSFDINELPSADVIVSNPPYIASSEIPKLQKEVLHEPMSALDGGNDGLDFYRCIEDRWAGKIKFGGYIGLECGENQSKDIIKIFEGEYRKKEVIFDFNNIDRIVTFRI